MMTFRFYGHKVTFNGGKLESDDEPAYIVLSPLIGCSDGSPQDGEPLINTITSIYGQGSVTEVEHDNDSSMIH